MVTASELIAIAAFADGRYSQAFPSFGVERTGAPIESYTRIDSRPIRLREQIYNPDILVILDASLLQVTDLSQGCGQETRVIINTSKKKEKLKLQIPQENIYTINATQIALDVIGKDIANTVILGSFAKNTEEVSLSGLKKAVKQKFQNKGQEIIKKNIQAIEKAYNY